MSPTGILLVGTAAALAFAAWSAWRARCEKRDVVCLGVVAGILAVPGAAILAL